MRKVLWPPSFQRFYVEGAFPRILALVIFLSAHLSSLAQATEFQFRDLTSKPVAFRECHNLLVEHAGPKVRLQDEPSVVFAEWNVENVFERRGKYSYEGVNRETGKYNLRPVPDRERPLEEWKFKVKQESILDMGKYVGADTLPHFIVSPEIENVKAAEGLFNTGPLSGRYQAYVIEGNDPRGFDVAFAVRSDLNVKIEFETHREVMWFDPVEQSWQRLYGRDLPVMLVRDGESDELLLILIGNHAKSKRDRPGDPESKIWSAAQYQAAKKLVENYRQRFGVGAHIIMSGDFNRHLPTDPEVQPIKTLLRDPFDILQVQNRVTQTYHPKDAPRVASQLDAQLISPSLEPHLQRAVVAPAFDKNTGKPLGLPKSFEDRNENYPSDHFATVMAISGRAFQR